MSSMKSRPFCLGLSVLMEHVTWKPLLLCYVLNVKYPWMKSTGAQSSNKLQWLQGNMITVTAMANGMTSPTYVRTYVRNGRMYVRTDGQGDSSIPPTNFVGRGYNNIWENPRMHVWCKFADSSSNQWRVIVQTRLSLRTDGRTDGRTDAGNLKGQGVIIRSDFSSSFQLLLCLWS